MAVLRNGVDVLSLISELESAGRAGSPTGVPPASANAEIRLSAAETRAAAAEARAATLESSVRAVEARASAAEQRAAGAEARVRELESRWEQSASSRFAAPADSYVEDAVSYLLQLLYFGSLFDSYGGSSVFAAYEQHVCLAHSQARCAAGLAADGELPLCAEDLAALVSLSKALTSRWFAAGLSHAEALREARALALRVLSRDAGQILGSQALSAARVAAILSSVLSSDFVAMPPTLAPMHAMPAVAAGMPGVSQHFGLSHGTGPVEAPPPHQVAAGAECDAAEGAFPVHAPQPPDHEAAGTPREDPLSREALPGLPQGGLYCGIPPPPPEAENLVDRIFGRARREAAEAREFEQRAGSGGRGRGNAARGRGREGKGGRGFRASQQQRRGG